MAAHHSGAPSPDARVAWGRAMAAHHSGAPSPDARLEYQAPSLTCERERVRSNDGRRSRPIGPRLRLLTCEHRSLLSNDGRRSPRQSAIAIMRGLGMSKDLGAARRDRLAGWVSVA